MTKLVYLAATAAIFACGVAAADIYRTIDVEITYDSALLTSDEGADAVMQSIQQQAEDACGTVSSYSLISAAAPRRDVACITDVVDRAVSAIKEQESEKGQPVSQQFAQLTQ